MWEAHRTDWTVVVGFGLLTVTLGGELSAQSSTTNPYRATFGWEKLPEGRTLGVVSGYSLP